MKRPLSDNERDEFAVTPASGFPGAATTRRRALAALAALAASTGAAAALGRGRDASSTEGALRFGQSTPITGVSQSWGIEYMRGLKLAFDDANARGGVGGRMLDLVSYDDGYEATTARDNTAELIAKEKVFGLIGYVGAEAVARSLPLAAEAGVPFIAPLTGDESLRRNMPRQLFHTRAGDDAETRTIAKTLATIAFTRIAVLQQDDDDGVALLDSLQRMLAAAGLPPPVTVVKVARNAASNAAFSQHDAEEAGDRLAAARPHAIVLLTAFATTAAVVRHLKTTLGYAGGCYATSLSAVAAIGPLLGSTAAGVSITQVVPSPFDTSRPLVASYQKRLLAAGATPEYVSLEGWIAGRVVIEALGRSMAGGQAASRERFMATLEQIGHVDLGGVSLRWDATRREFSTPVTLTVLDARGHPRA